MQSHTLAAWLTKEGQGWEQGDQLRSYVNNLGKGCGGLNQNSSSGGSKKRPNPEDIEKLETTGFSDGLDRGLEEKGVKGDIKFLT